MNLFSKPYIINTSQKPNSVSSDVCKVRNEFVYIVKLYTQVCPNILFCHLSVADAVPRGS